MLSVAAGIALGWWHFKRCERAVLALLSAPQREVDRRAVWVGGIGRHVFTLAAGFCLVGVARLDPFRLGVGMLLATALYRAHAIARRERD